MTDAERLVERLKAWNRDGNHLHGPDALSLEAATLITQQAAEIARLREALEWLDYHADNQDMKHVDFRVEGTLIARAALGAKE